MKAKLFKIKEGKLEAWKEWCTKLSLTLKEEALETLREENLLQEGCLFFSIGENSYVIGFVDGEALPSTDKPINTQNKEKIKECLEEMNSKVTPLYHLKTLN